MCSMRSVEKAFTKYWANRLLCVIAAAFCLAAPAWSAEPGQISAAELKAKTEALARASAAVVGVRTIAVEDARSVSTLGRLRLGTGVVIDDEGLVLTIGYLILEADHVEVVVDGKRAIPARVVAYDLASGFGLLQALAPLRTPAAKLGNSADLTDKEPLMVASGGLAGDLSLARMVSRRNFSGYWEYYIEGALFTTPPRTDHSGAGLFNSNGELMGIGSLVVMDALGPGQPRMAGNMFVPVDLLKPILAELRTKGATSASTRAWLGVNCVESEGAVRVMRVTPESPAEEAGLQPGDEILGIDDVRVSGLESLYKTLWRGTNPEREVTLSIRRGATEQTLRITSQDRMKTLRQAQGI